jgi:primosomal protein N'
MNTFMARMELECRACGYKFMKDAVPKICPYCSKQGKVGLAKTAQDLLDETFGEIDAMDEDIRRRS